jgi:hypothetical protein
VLDAGEVHVGVVEKGRVADLVGAGQVAIASLRGDLVAGGVGEVDAQRLTGTADPSVFIRPASIADRREELLDLFARTFKNVPVSSIRCHT